MTNLYTSEWKGEFELKGSSKWNHNKPIINKSWVEIEIVSCHDECGVPG